jgi:hypothetical protein
MSSVGALIRRIIGTDAKGGSRKEGWKMNSYVNLMLEVEAAKKRLSSALRTGWEADRQSQARSPANHQKFNRLLRPGLGSLAPSPEVTGRCVRGSRLATQSGGVTIETSVWIVSYLFAVLGLVRAAYSENPLVWLAVWPAPVALISTIFIFSRQGFHYRDGLLVLGRDRLSPGGRGDRS